MTRVLIFGAAGVGLKAKRKLEQEGIKVVAFSDNDEKKWNKEVDGCPVLPPYDINVEDYDLFAIGVYKHVSAIKNQLISMGVETENIIVPIPAPAQIFYNNKYEFLTPECNECIIMLWGGIESCTNNLQGLLCEKNKIRIDFKNNFWAFQYFIEDCLIIENPNLGKRFWEENAITSYSKLCVDVYFIDNKEVFSKLRQEFEGDEQFVFCSANYYINQMIRNGNTIHFWNQRVPRAFESEFLARIDDLKSKMMQYNIPLDEICVVSGAVLEAYGLRDSRKIDDLDIIMTDRFRQLYGLGLVIVSEKIEMHPQNELVVDKNNALPGLTDDEIIMNKKNYFWLRGVKFLDLELLYRQKESAGQQAETLLIKYFYDRLYLE